MRFLIMAIIGLCMMPLSARAHQTATDLTWSPPPLTAPNTYALTRTNAGIAVTKNTKPYRTFKRGRQVEINLKPDEDAIIELPQEILELSALRINHGSDLRIIGGHLKATQPANRKIRGLIWAGGTKHSVYIEGLILDADFQDGMDTLLVGGYSNQKPTAYPNIYVQNTIMKNMQNTDGNPIHSDCFQYYGTTGITHMDRVHCETNTQGFFLAPQHDIKAIKLKRVSIDYVDPNKANGYALYVRDNYWGRRNPIELEQVYVGRRETRFGYGHDGKWEVYSIFPHVMLKSDKGRAAAQRVGDDFIFTGYPEIKGKVHLRRDEYFVIDAGVGYKREE